MSQNLTRLAHELAVESLQPGDVAVDATAGNGHDTAFLAKSVGESGHVYAFDIQQTAIESTQQRLEKLSLRHQVSLILDGHENMARHIPAELADKIAVVFFNLGYLPRGNHTIITQGNTTLSALRQAANFLRAGGHLSLLVYPGHPGGSEEADIVRDWIQSQDSAGKFSFTFHGDQTQCKHPWLAVGLKKS